MRLTSSEQLIVGNIFGVYKLSIFYLPRKVLIYRSTLIFGGMVNGRFWTLASDLTF